MTNITKCDIIYTSEGKTRNPKGERAMKYYYCTNVYDGKVYDIYCEKFPDGRYNLQTKEARFVGLVSEVPYAKYIK